MAAIFALVSTVGWGWTLLALLATFLLGWAIVAPVAGSQLIRRLGQLRSGLTEPRDVASDSALVSLAAVLVLVPGLVSTALGLLLLIPPIRSAARPGLTAVAVRAVLCGGRSRQISTDIHVTFWLPKLLTSGSKLQYFVHV